MGRSPASFEKGTCFRKCLFHGAPEGIRILPFCAAKRHHAFGKMCISSAKKCAEMGGFSSLADAKTERRKSDTLFFLARPKEFESPTFRLGGGRSILLSYGRI